jgi:hypothetical protein
MIRRLTNDWDWMDWYYLPAVSYTTRGVFIDTDRYDIVPQKAEVERLLKEKEKEIELIDKKKEELVKQRDELLGRK